MQNHTPNDNKIPYGYCHCGCGQKTPIAQNHNPKIGYKKGEHTRFVVGHYKRKPKKLSDRFWDNVDKKSPGECWIWTAGQNGNGYGFLGKETTHRISWKLHFGSIPKHLCVLHKCDVKTCVNPNHLFLGTKGDNNRDRAKKGRNGTYYRKGEAHSQNKLTAKDVIEIRKLSKQGMTQVKLAARFGVTRFCIAAVIHGKSWSHL